MVNYKRAESLLAARAEERECPAGVSQNAGSSEALYKQERCNECGAAMEAARGTAGKVLRKADAGRAKRSQLSREAEKRQKLADDAALSGMKRKRDADPEDDGSVSASGIEEGPQLVRPPCCLSPMPPPLQQLLNACRAVLTSCTPLTPRSSAVAFVRGIMDKIGPNDVGLKDEIRFFHKMNMAGRQNPPIITCKPIYEDSNFTIAVFFLPFGSVIPIHDHPGMTVFTKLLIGSARLEAYDWVCPRAFSGVFPSSGSRMLAHKVRDHNVIAGASDSDTWVLFPNHGESMLRFTAAENTHCAFLDVLIPPPDVPVDQRRCSYYQDFDEFPYYEHHRRRPSCKSVSTGAVRGDELVLPRRLAWLEEIPKPRDLRIIYLPYGGPAVF